MAGVTVAMKCAKKGLKVGIADFRPYGGTCALRGCDPKKILINVAKAKKDFTKYTGKGLQAEGRIHWPDLMKFKWDFTDPVPDKMEKGCQKAGVDTFHDAATFLSENTLQAGDKTIRAKKIVMATGARPRTLSLTGAEHTITSDVFFTWMNCRKALPF